MMKKYTVLGMLMLLLAASALSSVTASHDNGASEIVTTGDIVPYVVLMEINCTWSHGEVVGLVPPAILSWSDSNTLPPLPNSGWGDQFLAITVTVPEMFVDIVVTDSFSKGDYFEVWEVDQDCGVVSSGYHIGTTPQVPLASSTTGLPDPAFADPTYSHGTFRVLLQSGIHYFAFREAGHNYGSGAFYVRFCPGPIVSPPVGGNLLPSNSALVSLVTLLGAVGAITIVLGSRKSRQL
jgi:hypothetical protein